MNSNIINTIILGISFICLFATAEIIYHFFKVQAEYTRKIVHIGTGILTMLFPLMLENHWYVLLLCSSFAVLLTISIKFNFLKSINAIDRNSVGSLVYPLSVYCCFLFYAFYGKQLFWFYLPIITMALADPAAALVGKHYPIGRIKLGEKTKTFSGSLAFFAIAFLLCTVFMHNHFSIIHVLVLSTIFGLITTFSEAISKKGWDNFFIPIASLIVLYFNHYFFNA